MEVLPLTARKQPFKVSQSKLSVTSCGACKGTVRTRIHKRWRCCFLRTNRFKAPYRNENGYYTCLFGGHHLSAVRKGKDLVVLVESEQIAIVGSLLLLPQFTWLAFGGLNGLTERKINALRDHKVLLAPDMSEKAVSVAYPKLLLMRSMGVKANIWDMTEGRGDESLQKVDLYNKDLEDLFRELLF